MKCTIFIFLLVLIIFPQMVVSAEMRDVSKLVVFDVETESIPVNISLENMALRTMKVSDKETLEFVFDVFLKNTSSSKKYDIIFPLLISVRDEFQNSYYDLALDMSSSEPKKVKSLYPGETLKKSCRFQAPVPAANALTVEVMDSKGNFKRRINLQTRSVENWNVVADNLHYSNDDLFIIYPKNKRVFSPGETVFLKLGFSVRAGRPSSIHVVLPDYVLTDKQAEGEYELVIPKGISEGKMEIVVMAEWESDYDASQIISKTLFLDIKG